MDIDKLINEAFTRHSQEERVTFQSLVEMVEQVMFEDDDVVNTLVASILDKLRGFFRDNANAPEIKGTPSSKRVIFTNTGNRSERDDAITALKAALAKENIELTPAFQKNTGEFVGGKISLPDGGEYAIELAKGAGGSAEISIEPVNLGNVAEGLFALGGLAKIKKNGANVSGKDIMMLRQALAGQNCCEAMVTKGLKIGKYKAAVKIKLEAPMFNPLFLPGDFGDASASPEAIKKMGPSLATVVSQGNEKWKELVKAGDWQTLGKMYKLLGIKLAATAKSAANYWNTTGAGGWENLLQLIDSIPPEVDPGVIWLEADGVDGEDFTTADAWIRTEKPVPDGKGGTITTEKKGRHILGEFSLKADSAQIAQGGGPGSTRTVTRSGETGEILSDKGGGIGIIATKLGVWDDVKATVPNSVQFFKDNASPSREELDTGGDHLKQYATHWNDTMDAIQGGLDKLLKTSSGTGPEGQTGKLSVLQALGSLITGGAENIDMKYVDLASGGKAKVAFPKSFPMYAEHFGMKAEPDDMVTDTEIEQFPKGTKFKQPKVTVADVEPMPLTQDAFDKAGLGYEVSGALEIIKEKVAAMGAEGEFPGAENAAAIFGGNGLKALGVKLSTADKKLLKYAPPDDPAEAATYEKERNAVMQKIQTTLKEADPAKHYSVIAKKVNSLLPKVGEDVFIVRWKLRLSGAKGTESRTYLEKRGGLQSVADYTKYLEDMGAQADPKTAAAVETIINASGKLLQAHEDKESKKRTK